jgi:tetratricopeptide (TPR) repeat protein
MKYLNTFGIRADVFKWALLIPFLGVMTTVFALDGRLADGSVSGKHFWFYGCMGLTGMTAVIAAFLPRRAFCFSAMDLFVGLFTGSVYVSALAVNDASGNTTKLTILTLLVALYFCFRILFDTFERREAVRNIFCFFLALTALAETAWGFLQLYGYQYSQHHLFRLTGSFFNPGPYAGYLAVVFPLALAFAWNGNATPKMRDRNSWPLTFGFPPVAISRVAVKWISALACIAILSVLPAAMSRASWLAVVSGSAVVWLLRTKAKNARLSAWLIRPKNRVAVYAIIVSAAVALAGMYLFKKKSADGRVLIWKVSLQIVAKHPFGVGLGNFPGAYGDAQADRIAEGNADETEKYVAGNPEYGFNEYLQIAAESGWISFLLFLGTLVCAFRSMWKADERGQAGSLTALSVFAFFSYPFSVIPYLIIFTFLIAAAGGGETRPCRRQPVVPCVIALLCFAVACSCLYRQYPVYLSCRQWTQSRIYYHSREYGEAARMYETLYPYLSDRIQFLFEYAQSLSKSGDPSRSNEVLQRAMQISCDPMLYNIAGKNSQLMKRYAEAEQYFLKAANIVPSRIYPWYMLALLYQETGETAKAHETAKIVLTKEPKVNSEAVREMREKMKSIIYE